MNTETTLELPYTLIDIGNSFEHLVFRFKSFDENQSEQSIERGGLTGQFEVSFKSGGIDCQFECDITVGNVYDFYIQLENVYECLPEIEPVAYLKNYGSLERTDMEFRCDKCGHWDVSGHFMDANTNYKSGFMFDIVIDTSEIYDILSSLELFFNELERLQGNRNFF